MVSTKFYSIYFIAKQLLSDVLQSLKRKYGACEDLAYDSDSSVRPLIVCLGFEKLTV